MTHNRVFLLSPEATWLTKSAFAALKKDNIPPTGAAKAYHESQSRIYKLEAPLFMGVGEGTDNMDFLADLSALKVIEPEEVARARSASSQPVPRSESELLQRLKQGEVPYAHCAWCEEALPTRYMLEQHYYNIHHVVLQPSCCAPQSVFQTIMGKELQLRQQNFSCFSTDHVLLRENMRHEDAREILGAICTVQEDKTKVWHVKMPEFIEEIASAPTIQSPLLHMLEDDEFNLIDYLEDPLDPVLCVPDQDHDHYFRLLHQSAESALGGPGSTMNFWDTAAGSQRLTLGVRMHSAAAFLSTPNSDGVVRGGNSDRGFNDNTIRGYPLRLNIPTRQVTDVVMYDEDILAVKGGRRVKDNRGLSLDEETRREEARKTCALRYLEGYPDTKVIDPIRTCTMPLAATIPLHVTPEILRNKKYAQEYVEHVALIRELLDQTSLSTNHALLMRGSNQLLKSIGGLLKGESDCMLTREPIPDWNLVKIVKMNSDAERVKRAIAFLCSDGNISVNWPSAPMPMPEGDTERLMHPALVTHLAEDKPYYMRGGLIPHLTKKGYLK